METRKGRNCFRINVGFKSSYEEWKPLGRKMVKYCMF